ncbi:nuclear transport factor 2 family protein [Plantactinospora sp. KLBMP9567]|uniref:nuclear transport factor 2 family protein n=1 Tax=Plantactinospora sp. KLBMP9567 TaxID=3085900 RepID=UPI002981938C|nr:nuclear transport factor 2 family protein [Plantactinospora sp. KLBMP9567]MDW5327098.1 nuclear transport factor 2 family protein [Plantactinospora sp. KLBMP9567]
MKQTPEAGSALRIAQHFITAVEAKDLDAVAEALAPDAQQLFMHTKRTRYGDGAATIVTGENRRAVCVAHLKGRHEVLAYTEGLMGKFNPLRWSDTEWSASPDGSQVFFRGKGNMVVARTGKPYRNHYVTIFDINDGRIVRMAEYADAFAYAGLRIRPNDAELRSFLRAAGRLLSFTRPPRPRVRPR